MNPNQAFCFAIAILLLKIIDMQQLQMFAFFILYQRWVHEHMQILNVAFLRRRRSLRRVRVAPYLWTIPRPPESWFEIHYNDPTVPQEYFRQQSRVYRNTFEIILHILGPRLETKFKIQELFTSRKRTCFGTVSFGSRKFIFKYWAGI